MFTFCDVLDETKQKMKTNSRECAVQTVDWESALIVCEKTRSGSFPYSTGGKT